MIIITDDTFGLGARFTLREVESIEGKTLRGKYYSRRKSHVSYCLANKRLAREAYAINQAMEDVQKRARKLRDKIKEKRKKDEQQNTTSGA